MDVKTVTNPESAPATVSPGTRPRWWPDVTLLALGALLVRIPSMFAPTQLGYDDGGYGLAAVAMRQGFAPFREIFSPQGPLFLPLVHVADVVGLHHRNAPRLLPVLAGIVVTLAVYAIGIQVTDRGRALLAAGLTAGSGVLLWTTGPITGDGPAAAFATSAVAVAVAYRRRPTLARVLVITLLAGCAVSTKSLLVGPALLTVVLLVGAARRWLHLALVPVGALAIVTVLALPWGLQHVLDDYVRYHLDKTAHHDVLANLTKIATTFWSRDPVLSVLAILAISTFLTALTPLGRRLRIRRPGPVPGPTGAPATATAGTWFLWWWAGSAAVVLTLQDPMFRNHLGALVAPATLLVACFRPSWRIVVIVTAIAVGFQIAHLRPLLLPRDFRATNARIVAALHRLPPNAWAISDTPGLVWRAGHGTDPFFVDPSVLRLDSHVDTIKITEDRLVRAASQPRVCAVAVTAPVRFGRYEQLPARLAALGYRPTIDLGNRLGLYEREHCAA